MLLLRASTVLVLLWTFTAASATPFRRDSQPVKTVVVFGDSFSDTGNIERIYGFPAAPYYQGRFSNGLVWVEYIAQALNNATMVNQAYGGAVANRQNLPLGASTRNSTYPPDVNEQLAWYLGNTTALPDPTTTLYPIFVGANDYLHTLAAGGLPVTSTIAGSVVTFIKSLHTSNLKASRMVVMTLPDFAKIPSFTRLTKSSNSTGLSADTLAQLATSFSTQHNAALEKGIKELVASTPGLRIDLVDLFGLFNKAISNPPSFNLTNVTAPCLSFSPGTTPTAADTAGNKDPSLVTTCSTPDSYLFWDNTHPTTIAHKFVADEALRVFNQPTSNTVTPNNGSSSTTTDSKKNAGVKITGGGSATALGALMVAITCWIM
ncbi:hypothetical protein SpCBS45565_g02444 [Spizellomyces sp. 'palustris']|nr:hypothetical protein SpCBS45565_g02444 [Spizellomyces sp. 'palustris']